MLYFVPTKHRSSTMNTRNFVLYTIVIYQFKLSSYFNHRKELVNAEKGLKLKNTCKCFQPFHDGDWKGRNTFTSNR